VKWQQKEAIQVEVAQAEVQKVHVVEQEKGMVQVVGEAIEIPQDNLVRNNG